MSHLRGKSVKAIHTVTNGQLEIVECEVASDSKASGKELKEISNSGSYLVLMDKKSGVDQYQIATGTTRIAAGDHIVLITVAENSKKVLAFFGSSE
jgi:trk system potassium uptake protein TrkA